MRKVYLDNSATTRTDTRVADKIYEMLTVEYGNPSSLHGMGARAYQCLGTARHQAAKMISADTSSIYFTSGGTESNNLAILGGAVGNLAAGGRLVTTQLEHSSVSAPFARLEKEGYTVTRVPPRKDTHWMAAGDIVDAVDGDTSLVSLMYVNNETGEILPVRETVQGIRKKNPHTLIHCDCVQGFGKVPFKLFEMDVDMLSASAHKLYGPKGVGCLFVKDRSRIEPRIFGGKQESGLKPGTENTALIAGFGAACDLALVHIRENYAHVLGLRDMLVRELGRMEGIHINSPLGGSPYILNVSYSGHSSDEIVSFMSSSGIYISAGSACSKGARSHVIEAMGYSEDIIRSAVRISLSHENTQEDIRCFLEALGRMGRKECG